MRMEGGTGSKGLLGDVSVVDSVEQLDGDVVLSNVGGEHEGAL